MRPIIVESLPALPDDCESPSIEKVSEILYIRSPECVAVPEIGRRGRDWESPRQRNNYKSRRRR